MTKTNSSPALIALSGSLRATRTDRGLGLRRLADKLGVAAQTLLNWETGHRAPKIDDLAHLLGFLRVSPAEYQRIIRLWHQIESATLIETLGLDTTSLQQKFDELAIRTWEWAPHDVPEPLQTVEYARAVLQRDQIPPDDIDVELLLRNAGQLDRKQPRQWTVLLSEAALAPAPESQLHALNTMSDSPHLRIRLVPATDKILRTEPFTIYETHSKVFTVAFRHHDNVIFVNEQTVVHSYRSTFKALEQEAIDHVARA